MTIRIANPEETVALGLRMGAELQCKSERTLESVQPPRESPTANTLYSYLHSSPTTITVAFIDGGNEIIGSCYDHEYKTVFIRADKRYVLTEYDPPPELPFVVLLYHELGHAKQDLDGTRLILTAQSNTKEFSTGEKKLTWVNGRRVPMPVLKSGAELHRFDYHLEYANMRLHEHPICRELGIPLRSRYTDIAEG